MGGVRRERSSPAAAKGANSCGAGPQGLTYHGAPRPKERMSFKSREKKRRYKAAVEKSKRAHAPETARRWFLTLAKKPGRLDCCGNRFERGAEIVYRHEPRETRCLRCADRLEDSKGYRPSLRWERARRVPRAAA